MKVKVKTKIKSALYNALRGNENTKKASHMHVAPQIVVQDARLNT